MAVCTSCSQENPTGARFCNACGRRGLAPAPGDGVEVRKTVTALFCDVVDSTPLAERLDPEVLRGVMGRYFDQMRDAVEEPRGAG